jgi:hypothetical protein
MLGGLPHSPALLGAYIVKRFVVTAAIAAAIAMPSMLFAADDMAMKPAPKPMFVCHTATSGQAPNAMMGSTGMMCGKVDMEKMMAAVKKVHAMEGNMDAPTRAAVQALENMITQGPTYAE